MKSLQSRKSRAGFLFCLPFLIGIAFFFLKPAIASLFYAFGTLSFTSAGLKMEFIGLDNFKKALFLDPIYVRTIVESIKDMVIRVPVILMLSLFVAVLLNQRFRGRVFFRAVFFLPVIVVNGIIMEILQSDYLSNEILQGQAGSGLFNTVSSSSILLSLGFSEDVIKVLMPFAYDIFDLVWSSGVPILMFLASLQTVPSQLYEVARIEGATNWEQFWKITFPMISPMLLMNTVYIIADFFTTSTNPVIKLINNQTSNMRFEYASGLSWMYFVVVGIIVAAAFRIIDRYVVYTE